MFKIIKFLSLILLVTPFFSGRAFAQTGPNSIEEQPKSVQGLLDAEKNTGQLQNLVEIIQHIDSTYKNLHESLSKGGKIVVFIDPAHGKLPSGLWQGGAATARQSCTNKPEEYYSIILSRKIYSKLKVNPFIEIKTTDDFMEVLRGESDIYRNIPFSATISMAKESNAFIIISEHLNNVSAVQKASGIMNVPGIHIINGIHGRKVLRYISDTYKGFLTLYNRVDASGFSRNYALNIKSRLMERGLQPNSWQYGAVGDDRFSYFVDFPISIIYESGFISNPVEEALLRDDKYTDTIVSAQYDMLLKTIEETFNVDISGKSAEKVDGDPSDNIELLKLSRIAVHYIRNGMTREALRTIGSMESRFGKGPLRENVAYFRDIRNRLSKAEENYYQGCRYLKKKMKRTASRYFYRARTQVGSLPIFSAYREKYSPYASGESNTEGGARYRVPQSNPSLISVKAAKLRPILLAIDDNESLEQAVRNALDPDEQTMKKLMNSFRNARNTRFKKVSTETKKGKKVTKWRKFQESISFSKGVYIVTMDKNLNINKAQRVSSAVLDPLKYQNQQYLKNSWFSRQEREKSL